MTFSPSPSDPSSSSNGTKTATLFSSPEWYLKGYAANIRIRSETVTSVCGSFKNSDILDIGCGDGSISLPLLKDANRITFLDLSEAMLTAVAGRINSIQQASVKFIVGDFMAMPMPTSAFDLVICVGVLAYVSDISAFLSKIFSILRPGGTLILECTDSSHFLCRMDRIYLDATARFKPRRFETVPHTAHDVLAASEKLHFTRTHTFRYAYSFPLFWRFTSQHQRYKLIRFVFGTILSQHRQQFGNQCIFIFQR